MIATLRKIRPYLRTKMHKFWNWYAVRPYQKDFARLQTYAAPHRPLKLHFGCGPRVLRGWINIDLHYEPYKNYLCHYGDVYPPSLRGTRNDFYALNIMKTGLPLSENSVDLIFHEDFIEHLDQKEQVLFLAETLRVLKPGCVHRINTPNLEAIMGRYSDFTQGVSGVYEREWDGHGHKNIFTANSLKDMALMVGYRTILFNGKNMSIAQGIPPEYRPGTDRLANENLFIDLMK